MNAQEELLEIHDLGVAEHLERQARVGKQPTDFSWSLTKEVLKQRRTRDEAPHIVTGTNFV